MHACWLWYICTSKKPLVMLQARLAPWAVHYQADREVAADAVNTDTTARIYTRSLSLSHTAVQCIDMQCGSTWMLSRLLGVGHASLQEWALYTHALASSCGHACQFGHLQCLDRIGLKGDRGMGGGPTFNMFALIMIVRGLSSPLLLQASPLAICSPSILRSNDPEELTCAGLQANKAHATKDQTKTE